MKNKHNSLAIFENFRIRRHYDEKTETWYFSVIDIVGALIDQLDYNRAKTYWTTLKNRLKVEGSEVVTKCDQLKMIAQDGKITKDARIALEEKTGKSVVTGENYLPNRKNKKLAKV